MQEYKVTLMRAVESAVRTLVEAQQKCEELYITVSDEARSEKPVAAERRPEER